MSEAKQRDSRRQAVSDWFALWQEKHSDEPVAVSELHDDVKQSIDPQGRGRQYVASQLERYAGTRIGGFVLERQTSVGKWGRATYAIKTLSGNEEDRGHRGHRDRAQQSAASEPSDAPYAKGEHCSTATTLTTPTGVELLAVIEPTGIPGTASSTASRLWRTRI